MNCYLCMDRFKKWTHVAWPRTLCDGCMASEHERLGAKNRHRAACTAMSRLMVWAYCAAVHSWEWPHSSRPEVLSDAISKGLIRLEYVS